jgi:uncharacterized membrane protein YfcA
VAGAVNAIAGGGSLITFPLLVWLGREPILANATNTVSLSPGSVAALYGFRRELSGLDRWIVWGSIPSILGGWAGGWLLLRTPERVFEGLVPWLIAFATLLFALSAPLTRWVRRHARDDAGHVGGVPVAPRWPQVLLYQFLVSVYGGYFGAGIGILMLSALGFMGVGDIHRMNAVKTFLAATINAASVVVFVRDKLVNWDYAWPMAAAAVVGGYAGARVARRLPAQYVRYAVIVIGFGLSAFYFIRRYS